MRIVCVLGFQPASEKYIGASIYELIAALKSDRQRKTLGRSFHRKIKN
jgi:hypothetical protein